MQGASADQLTTLYSNLYRLFLYPNAAHENVGTKDRPEWRHADQSGWSQQHAGGERGSNQQPRQRQPPRSTAGTDQQCRRRQAKHLPDLGHRFWAHPATRFLHHP